MSPTTPRRAGGVATVAAVAALLVALVSGCAATPAAEGTASARPASASGSPSPGPTPTPKVVVPQDATAFAILERVAPLALNLRGGSVDYTECWTPSQHMFLDASVAPAGAWKVLCRVHYTLDGTARYQDANCIGDFDATPMLDHCFVWKYHSDLPVFGDGDRLASPAPTPLP